MGASLGFVNLGSQLGEAFGRGFFVRDLLGFREDFFRAVYIFATGNDVGKGCSCKTAVVRCTEVSRQWLSAIVSLAAMLRLKPLTFKVMNYRVDVCNRVIDIWRIDK